jgi:hypothetical protein
MPVFRKDHAPPKIQSVMTIQPRAITLWTAGGISDSGGKQIANRPCSIRTTLEFFL